MVPDGGTLLPFNVMDRNRVPDGHFQLNGTKVGATILLLFH